VLATLIFRGWGVFAGAGTVLMLPYYLNPIEQGYYFTFASILAIQIFFELGLNQIVVQMVSHEVAHITPENSISSSSRYRSIGRLHSLIQLIGRWYGVAAITFTFICSAAGIAFFLNKEGAVNFSAWLGPWVCLVMVVAFNLWLSPKMAILEGCGKVGQVARIRLIQSSLGYIFLWISLAVGLGLWAVIAIPLFSALCTSMWLRDFEKKIEQLFGRPKNSEHQISWRLEIFPLQWKIALSWISGYFIFNLFTPLAFSQNGPVEAGRLGISLTIFAAILTVGMSWVNAKTPNFTMLLAHGERVQLNKLFIGLFIRSILAVSLMSTLVVLASWYGERVGLVLMQRIASPQVLAILGATTIVNAMIYAMAIYMRANREEPMLIQSLVIAILVGCAVLVTAKHGVQLMMFSYMLICVFISLPWTLVLFRRYSRCNIKHSTQ